MFFFYFCVGAVVVAAGQVYLVFFFFQTRDALDSDFGQRGEQRHLEKSRLACLVEKRRSDRKIEGNKLKLDAFFFRLEKRIVSFVFPDQGKLFLNYKKDLDPTQTAGVFWGELKSLRPGHDVTRLGRPPSSTSVAKSPHH